MTKFLSTIAAISGALLSVAAHAHTVTTLQNSVGINPSSDPRPCVFFRIDGGIQWYAVPSSHAQFDFDKAMLLAARMTGDPGFDFFVGPAIGNCSNIPEAFDLQLN